MSNEHADAVIAAGRSMIGWPYRLGGTTEAGIDCRGFVHRAFKMVGLRDLIGAWQPNVRAEVQWARNNGRLRLATTTPEPGWLVFYSSPDGKGPNKLQHVGIVLAPPSPQHPFGRAISAVVPTVREHRLDKRGLTIFGYCEPDWPDVEVDPPSVDPEPPVEAEPTQADYDAALARADAAEAEVARIKAAVCG